MKREKKYELIKIDECYVSSTSHAYLRILVNTYSKGKFEGTLILNIQPDGALQYENARSFEHSFFDPPKYLINEIKQALKTHKFSFYEYDKYGEVRTEGLQYTDKDLIISRYIDYANSKH